MPKSRRFAKSCRLGHRRDFSSVITVEKQLKIKKKSTSKEDAAKQAIHATASLALPSSAFALLCTRVIVSQTQKESPVASPAPSSLRPIIHLWPWMLQTNLHPEFGPCLSAMDATDEFFLEKRRYNTERYSTKLRHFAVRGSCFGTLLRGCHIDSEKERGG